MPTLAELLKPLTETKEQKKQRFHQVLGEFISACASAEQGVHIVFSHIIRIAVWKTRAITGGQKLSVMTTLLRAVAKKGIKSESKKKELDNLLAHLDAIATLRNALVHRTVDITETDFIADDFHTAKSVESAKELRFQIEHIQHATFDLKRITVRLYMLRARKSGLSQLGRARRKDLFAPWRYKPLAQQKLWNRLLADALMRRNQPQPSPA